MYKVSGGLSHETANQVAAAGLAAITAGQLQFDLSELAKIDSSAVAVMIEWQRQASRLGKQLAFQAAPASLISLIDLYGLKEQFNIISPERH